MKISIIIPLFNEEKSLFPLMKSIYEVMNGLDIKFEVLFIDDGSTDNSIVQCRKLYQKFPDIVRVVSFGRNYGKAAALSVGISRAEGDVIVTMDADLQDDPKAIPEMLEKLDQGYDLVSGWKKKRYDPITKTLPSKLWNFTVSILSGLKLHDFNCGFKAYRATAAKTIEIYGERHRYLPVLAKWNGFRITEIPVPHHPRKYGKSKYGISRAFKGIFDLLTLLFLRKYMKNPLHFFGLLGIFFGISGVCILGYFGVQWIITREMHIRPLVLLSIGAIIMGIQFVSIGLIGEMIANTQVKDNYIIREEF